jgi:hypothetical protein
MISEFRACEVQGDRWSRNVTSRLVTQRGAPVAGALLEYFADQPE